MQGIGMTMVFVWAAVVVGLLAGWVMNIFDLLGMTLQGNEPEVIIRAVGIIVVPLGGVAGWF